MVSQVGPLLGTLFMKGASVKSKLTLKGMLFLIVVMMVLLCGAGTVSAQGDPPWWNGYAPAPQDDPGVYDPNTYVSPYGVVIRYNWYQAKRFTDTMARLYSSGYEIVASGKIQGQDAVLMSGVSSWSYATWIGSTMNSFAAAAGPPGAIYDCAMDRCCLNPSSCETVYQ
jgi:hypothetical protein